MSFYSGDDAKPLQAENNATDKELEEFLIMSKHKADMNAQALTFSDFCWDTCVDKPATKMDSKTSTCLSNCVNRFFDVTLFIATRIAQKSQKNAI